jgi:hypothetical protein
MKNHTYRSSTGRTAASSEKSNIVPLSGLKTPGRRGRKPKKEKDDFNDLNFSWEGDAYEAEGAWDEYGRKPAYGQVDDEDTDESYTHSYSRRRYRDGDDEYDSDSYESFRRG